MQHAKKALMPYVDRECPDECVHLCSLIWTFSICQHILPYPLILLRGDKEGPFWLIRPMWFTNCIRALFMLCASYGNTGFSKHGPNIFDEYL